MFLINSQVKNISIPDHSRNDPGFFLQKKGRPPALKTCPNRVCDKTVHGTFAAHTITQLIAL